MTVNHLYPTTRPSLDLNFARQKRLDPRVTFTRGSTATYVGSDGLIKTAASNEARFDHDPATGESLGLLVEESRTNLLTYSEQFDNAAWSRAGVNKEILAFGSGSVANATTAPDGTTTADLVVPNTTSALHYAAAQSNSIAAGTYSFSCYIKPAGYSWVLIQVGSGGNGAGTYFDTSSGQVGSSRAYGSGISVVSSSIAKVGNGWYRCAVVVTSPITVGYAEILFSNGDGDSNATFAGNGTSGIYLWGAQLEAGSFPTSYIPTSGSTVTRSADVASMTASPYLYGTFLARYKHQPPTNLYRQIFSVGAANAYSAFLCRTKDNKANIVLPNIIELQTTTNTETSGFNNVATARVVGDYAVCLNGGTVAKTSSTSDQTDNSVITFMYGTIGTTSGGHISRLTYYPTRLTDSQLQELTR